MPNHASSLNHPSARRGRAVKAAAGLSLVSLFACSSAFALEYTSSVFVSNLNSPRGLAFSPDGALYIAEAGIPEGDGPSTLIRGVPNILTNTGSVTLFYQGVQTRVLQGLPSLYDTGSLEAVGPNDVTFGADGKLYVTIGAGFDPAVRTTDLAPNGINLGRVSYVGGSYDVGGYEATENPAGGPIDSNPWRAVAHDGGLLVTDAGGNSLLNIAADGTISTITTFPGRDVGGGFPSDAVPTGLAVGPDGNFYVGQLTGFPFTEGESQIFQVQPDGTTTVFATGFTQISSLAFGDDGSLYVLEYDSNGLLVPGDGSALIRLGTDGSRTTIFSEGLVQATGLAIGPDGAFYVSNYGTQTGTGEVLRIAAVPEPETYALMLAGLIAVGVMARKRRNAQA